MEQSTKQNRARREPAALSSLPKYCLTAAVLAWGLTASAQTLTTSTNFTVGALIPDGDISGLASAQSISTPITSVSGLKVTVKLSGNWNGDLYCYLTHGAGHSVLLNRVGRLSASPLGYHDAGLEVTFDDAAPNGDLHVYRLQLSGSHDTALSGPLTEVWAPDARVASPTRVLDTDARSAFLSSFNGVDPNGEWVLFVADLEAGDLHTLENWGLEITGASAPEKSLSQATNGSQGDATLAATAANQIQTGLNTSTPVIPAVLTRIAYGSGAVTLRFTGSAGSTYQVERATALLDGGAFWTNIGAVTIDNTGQGNFTDPNPPASHGYYRAVGQ